MLQSYKKAVRAAWWSSRESRSSSPLFSSNPVFHLLPSSIPPQSLSCLKSLLKMTMSADRAPLHQQQAPPLVEAVGATAAPKSTPTPRWVPGLLTAFTAIALAVRGPPPVIDKNAYFLSLSAAFFARVAGVMAAVAVRPPPASTGSSSLSASRWPRCSGNWG